MLLRLALVSLLLACACSDKIEHVQVTEILLRVHADSDVRALMKKLRVTIAVPAAEGAWQPRLPPLELEVPARADFWPVDIPITPHDPSHLPTQFEIVIDAFDDAGQALVQERAITSFLARTQHMLELTLARCGTRAIGSLCEDQPACHGTTCRRCDHGACGDTGVTRPDALASFPTTTAVDVADAPDASVSAGAGGRDAAADGGGGSGGGDSGRGGGASGSAGHTSPSTDARAGSGGKAPATASAPEVWSSPELLEDSDVTVTNADASRNDAGDLVVVWRQDTSTGPYWMRCYVDDQWDSDALNVSGFSPDANVFDATVGIDRNGAAQILYSDGEPHTYWLRWQGEASLPLAAPPLALGNQTYGYPTLFGLNESGNAAVIWGSEPDQSTQSQMLFTNRFDVSTGWGTPMMIGTTDAQLRGYGAGINTNGDWVGLFRAGTGSGPNIIKSFVSRGNHVSTPGGFDVPDAVVSGSFLVGVDDSGNALALYLAGPDPQQLRFHWSRLGANDASWANEMALTPAGTVNGAYTLVDKSLQLIAFESASSGGALHLVAYRFDEGQGWSAGERISDDFMSAGQDLIVTANASGAMIATWIETTASGTTLAYKRFANGKGWGDKGTITSFSGASTLAAASLNADGRAIVVWSQAQASGSGTDLKWSRSR